MKNISYLLSALFFFSLIGLNQQYVRAQDATAIVRKADEKFRGDQSKAELTMKIIRPGWERTVSMQVWTFGTKFSMILITAPARDEGTAYLKRDNEIWNWVPRIGRVVKMPPSMMSQSWMGSDFTNDDLIKEASIVTDYTHKLIGDSTVSGRDCYKVQLTPKPDAPVVWSKIIMWISKNDYLELRSEFYNEYGEKVNVMEGSEIKTLGGRLLPAKLEMIPQDKENQKTVLEYKDINFKPGISQGFFSVQQMKRLQ
ncbi:MAG TPA: outer membrane lipoprotein-sorting protein [Balneolaceae bacterium]|nr:outer membrane lipoprotein-sorting protein [Balneolaceae bacterium]